MTTITKAIEQSARAAIAARTEALFRESGALRDGHFLLKSGRHSDAYLEKFAVLSDPAATSELCAFWAGQHRGADDRPTVDLVAGPTTGGVILAFETGRQLGTRAIFAEEVKGDGPPRREFRRGFRIEPGERVLLVDDILTTGGSLAGDDPGRRGRGRRDRRMRGARRPIRRPERARLALDRPALWAQRALDPRPADVRARARDVPALRGGRARPCTGEHRRGFVTRRLALLASRLAAACQRLRRPDSPRPAARDRGRRPACRMSRRCGRAARVHVRARPLGRADLAGHLAGTGRAAIVVPRGGGEPGLSSEASRAGRATVHTGRLPSIGRLGDTASRAPARAHLAEHAGSSGIEPAARRVRWPGRARRAHRSAQARDAQLATGSGRTPWTSAT